jgi:hypothetical protein
MNTCKCHSKWIMVGYVKEKYRHTLFRNDQIISLLETASYNLCVWTAGVVKVS